MAGPLVRRRISRTYKRTAYHLQVLTVRDADGREQTLRVTDEHPFHVAGQGWTAARKLLAGDRLLGAAGEDLAVISNLGEDHPEGVTVYNLEVEDAHTYFVRAQGSDGDRITDRVADAVLRQRTADIPVLPAPRWPHPLWREAPGRGQ